MRLTQLANKTPELTNATAVDRRAAVTFVGSDAFAGHDAGASCVVTVECLPSTSTRGTWLVDLGVMVSSR